MLLFYSLAFKLDEIRFTEPPECHYPPGSSLSEITKHSLDTSYILHKMAEKHDR